MLLFILALITTYYEINNDSKMVMLYTGAKGAASLRVSPSMFFYIVGGFFVLLNLLVSGSVQALSHYPLSKMPVPQRDYWLQDADSRQNLREVLQSWMHFLAIILNIFLVLLLVKVWLINRTQGGKPEEYLYYVVGLIGVLAIWVGFIFYRLRLRKVDFIQ